MFFLPAMMGGLGIRDPIDLCDVDFDSSRDGVTVISAAIGGTTEFDWSEHLASLHAASVSRHESVNSLYDEKLHLILDQFPDAQRCAIKRAVGGGISHWLTTIPLERYHFDLAPIEFRDALALGYCGHPLVFPVGVIDVKRVLPCSMVLIALKVALSSGGIMRLGTVWVI